MSPSLGHLRFCGEVVSFLREETEVGVPLALQSSGLDPQAACEDGADSSRQYPWQKRKGPQHPEAHANTFRLRAWSCNVKDPLCS